MPMKEKEVAQLPGLRQWLRYWRNSLADAESGRGALTRRELEQSLPVGREAYRQGRLAPEVVGRLFSGEAESVELLRGVLRPAVYMALLEHGQGRRALFPEVMTPLICVLWVTREGRLIPAEPPVIPRDLLGPQADDRFTLNDVVEQDRFLTLEMPRVWSAQEAQGLLAPLTVVFMIPWVLWFPITRDPDSVLSTVLSFIPPVNSFAIILRLASNSPPPWWQVWLSILVGVASVFGAVWFTGKIFRIGLLVYGKPPSFSTLLRWAREA